MEREQCSLGVTSETVAQNSCPSGSVIQLGIIEMTLPKLLFTCTFELASSSRPEYNRNGGTWKIYAMSGGEVSGPRSSQAERQARPLKEMLLRVSHSACQHTTWWHHFCDELSVQPPFLSFPLSPSLYVSLCPQAMAIRCCQGHPFLKSVWWGSPGSFADRGHTHKISMCATIQKGPTPS